MLVYYVVLRGIEKFQFEYNSYPGEFDDHVEPDIIKLKVKLPYSMSFLLIEKLQFDSSFKIFRHAYQNFLANGDVDHWQRTITFMNFVASVELNFTRFLHFSADLQLKKLSNLSQININRLTIRLYTMQ